MGRTKSFDPDQVLNQALLLFWQQGYDSTSVSDLEKTLGINKFSLYQTFGSKHELYVRALDRYIQDRFTPLLSLLQGDQPNGLQAINLFFDTLTLALESQPEKVGCFVTAAGTERSSRDHQVRTRVNQVYGELEDGFYRCLESAQRRGELQDHAPIKDLARFFLIQAQGMLTVARNQQDMRTIGSGHGIIKQLINQWIVNTSQN